MLRDMKHMMNAPPLKVEVVPYDARWPDFFRREADRIQGVLGSHIKEIYHIGSTAIPGMVAKPVIDMMLGCHDLDEIDLIAEKLKALHYEDIRRHIIPHQSFFTRRQDKEISFHLHLHERGSPQIKRHVNFRDYVIQHPEEAKAYAALKIKLSQKFSYDIDSYVRGKDSLVQEIDRKAKQWPNRKKDYLPAHTGSVATRWSHEKLIKAVIANLNVYKTYFPQYISKIELIRVPGLTIVNSGLPDNLFNYVMDADFSAAEADKKISEVTHMFLPQKIPFSWWVGPYDNPKDLGKYLENNGYQNTKNDAALYFDLDAWEDSIPAIPQLEIVQAKDEKTLRDFALVLATHESAFETYFSWIASVLTEDDPIEYYVGYVNGKPVVRGSSCYFAQVVGLHGLSTAVGERKKGYGTAMQQFRLKRAKALGYHIAILRASSEGYPLYQRLGYKECGTFKEFILPNCA